MVFGIALIVFTLGIAFWHYLQGFFGATMSAAFAAIAASVAVGYEETVIQKLLPGKANDMLEALVLCGLFIAVYGILRLIFDKIVPGNVQMAAAVEKVGGAIMGLFAGILCTGVLAMAADSLPFGPSIAGYSRYPLTSERDVTIPPAPGRQSRRDSAVYDEMTTDLSALQSTLLLPVDDWLIDFVQRQSTGALAGDQPVTAVHPDWMQELWAQRVGIQVGAKHVANNLASPPQVKVAGLYTLPAVNQADPEFPKVREFTDANGTKLPAVRKPPDGDTLLVVRVDVAHAAAETTSDIDFTPAQARLAVGGKNYYPIGTMGTAGSMWLQKVDDPLFIDSARGQADLVYEVPAADLAGNADADGNAPARPGTLFVFKRFGLVDLDGRSVSPVYAPSDKNGIIRKPAGGAAAEFR